MNRIISLSGLFLSLMLLSCKPSVADAPLVENVTAKYSADLSGENVRPNPTSTRATGKATFTELQSHFGLAGTPVCVIDFRIDVDDITGITVAHIHAPTITGEEVTEVVRTLFENIEGTGAISGTLMMSRILGTFADTLVVAMRTGRSYVDVHTKSNPDGEIRSQIIVESTSGRCRTGTPN